MATPEQPDESKRPDESMDRASAIAALKTMETSVAAMKTALCVQQQAEKQTQVAEKNPETVASVPPIPVPEFCKSENGAELLRELRESIRDPQSHAAAAVGYLAVITSFPRPKA